MIVTSALRVSSKPVDYKTQILKHSFYLTDEFRRSDHKFWATEGISVMERVMLYTKQLMKYSSIEMQVILNFYTVAAEKGVSWKDKSKEEKLHSDIYEIYRNIYIHPSKC